MALRRARQIQYQNTLGPRVGALVGANNIVIDISKPIVQVARARLRNATPEHAEHVNELVKELEKLEELWVEMAEQSSTYKTTLTKVSKQHANLLLRHGYLSAWVSLADRIHFDASPSLVTNVDFGAYLDSAYAYLLNVQVATV